MAWVATAITVGTGLMSYEENRKANNVKPGQNVAQVSTQSPQQQSLLEQLMNLTQNQLPNANQQQYGQTYSNPAQQGVGHEIRMRGGQMGFQDWLNTQNLNAGSPMPVGQLAQMYGQYQQGGGGLTQGGGQPGGGMTQGGMQPGAWRDPYDYQGNRVAPLGGLTQQGLSASGQMGQQGLGAIGNLLNPMAQGGALDAVFGRGMDMFGRASEQIANKYGAMDATSSSGARDAQNRALEQFALASQAQAGPMALQSMGQGLSAMPGLQQALFQGGTIQQGYDQSLINERIAAMQRLNPLNSQAFSTGAQLAGMPTIENVYQEKNPSMAYNLSSAMLGGAADSIGTSLGNKLGSYFG